MANDLLTPTLTQLVNRIQTDIKTEIPQTNPFLPNSWMLAFIISLAGRFDENYNQLQSAFNDLFLPTSTDELLDSWGTIWGIARIASQASIGGCVATGVASTIVPQGTILNSSDNISYEVTDDATIDLVSKDVTLTRSGTTVTATSGDGDFEFATGQTVEILGATPNDYNGSYVITMTSTTSFTYTIETTPDASSGAISASAVMAVLAVTSTTGGSNTLQQNGAQLSFDNSILNVDPIAYVDFNGLTGGADEETDDAYRDRILERVQNPIANFSESQIIATAKEVPGVTRVWVKSSTPNVGAVTVYFVRDNDDNIIPDSAQIQAVKDKLNTIRPVLLGEDSLYVLAPTPLDVNFVFSSIYPSSVTMQNAILASLQQFFKEVPQLGEYIQRVAYDSAIYSTVDPDTGEKVQSFNLGSPFGNVKISPEQIGVLGSVSF